MGFIAQMRSRYLMRRLMVLMIVVLFIALAVIAMLLFVPEPVELETPPEENTTGGEDEEKDTGSSLLLPPEPERGLNLTNETEALNESNQTIEENITTVLDDCIEAPLPDFGCLNTFEEQNGYSKSIFGVYGLNVGDRNVEKTIDKVERECSGRENVVSCAIETAVFESENSWVCEWDCLRDIQSCEIYKMHLAVIVGRQFAPPEDIFVARTENFNFYVLENSTGDWIARYKNTRSPVTAIYNDYYYIGEPTEVTIPEIIEVDAGDEFCFEFYANESGVCEVEVQSFAVGDCPQLPADLRSICDRPITEAYVDAGKNKICFNVLDDADEEFYTYNFVLTSGAEWIPTGNAFVKKEEYHCPAENVSFKGFLAVED